MMTEVAGSAISLALDTRQIVGDELGLLHSRRFSRAPTISGLPLRADAGTWVGFVAFGPGRDIARVVWLCVCRTVKVLRDVSADRDKRKLLKIAGGCTIIRPLDSVSLRSPCEDAGGIL